MTSLWSSHLAQRHEEGWRESTQNLAEEVPVALVFDGTTQAVMMASPADLEDFLIGFALTEGVISGPDDIRQIEVLSHANGLEARAWLAPGVGAALVARRRSMAGPVGCGLCGIDSLEQVLRPIPPVAEHGALLSPRAPALALASLAKAQRLHDQTRAAHAAGYWHPQRGLIAMREDIGRHNALDKLAGALARMPQETSEGAVVLTSRLSVDLVQKAAMIGARVLIGASAPTALAVQQAHALGVTLIGRTREQSFDLYTHPQRISAKAAP